MALPSVTDGHQQQVVGLAARTHELQSSLYRHVRKDPGHALSPALARHVRELTEALEALVRCQRMRGEERLAELARIMARLSNAVEEVRQMMLTNIPGQLTLVDPGRFGAGSSLAGFMAKPSAEISEQIEVVIDVVQSMDLSDAKAEEPLGDEELGPIEKALDDAELWLAAHQAL